MNLTVKIFNVTEAREISNGFIPIELLAVMECCEKPEGGFMLHFPGHITSQFNIEPGDKIELEFGKK